MSPPDQALAAAPAGQVLATKLYLPRARRDAVLRPQLFARLDAALEVPLTLVAAPAGFGKTTVLAMWLAQQRAAQSAWLALDADDNDPASFVRYLVAALQTVAPSVGQATLALLQSPQTPAPAALLTPLLNDLAALPHALVLALDDYHLITTPAIHELLAWAIARLPPHCHLLLASRADPPLPLARLRARGMLLEIRSADLRFRADEAAAFLRRTMAVPISDADAAALEQRTEGWAAGLQLAALALRERADQADFISAFTGSNRYVIDYLAEEVLERLPPQLGEFVLQTSILDRMCGELCDAVLERNPAASDGDGRHTLAELEQMNLFVVPLDEARRWYRYHNLFSDVMRERLLRGASRETLAGLHARASAWLEREGALADAIRHALAAADWSRAARLVGQQGTELLGRGELVTLQGWMHVLPPDVRAAHPRLTVLQAWLIFLLGGNWDSVEPLLAQAEASLAASGEGQDAAIQHLVGEIAALRGTIAVHRIDVTQAIAQCRLALQLLPADSLHTRSMVLINLGEAYWYAYDTQTSIAVLEESIAAARAGGHLFPLLYGYAYKAITMHYVGQLRAGLETCRRAFDEIGDASSRQPAVGLVLYMYGHLLREQNMLTAAQRNLDEGVELCRQLGHPEVLADALALRARALQAQGLEAEARASMAEARRVATSSNLNHYVASELMGWQVQLWLLQGDLASALEWAQGCGLGVDDELVLVREPEYIALARVLLASGQPAAAESLLARLAQNAEAGGRFGILLQILCLRAPALVACGEPSRALAALARALALATPEGYLRVFIDEGSPMRALLGRAQAQGEHAAYARRLLDAFGDDTSPGGAGAEPKPAEPLTPRELEVLRLLAAGRSNQQIAESLVVAVGTVKRHLNNIFVKLGSSSRLEAVARARELGLLG
jgi:LuxR family transcriptional regulator, maltose regulon positive regulatory protein